jgi:SAM-dependent methyltransferase
VNEDTLIPPVEMLIRYDIKNQEQFTRVGENFLREFVIRRARLKPDHRVLDIGCGIGGKARPLTVYLNLQGGYDGIDIVRDDVEWCRKAYKDYPNFRFHISDLFNKHYNPRGTLPASGYKFPFPNDTFDVIFACSVFTHMLPKDVENYFSEISRILKPGGRAVLTYFLWNEEAAQMVVEGASTIAFPHTHVRGVCRLAKVDDPEYTVCYEESYIRSLYRLNRQDVAEVCYGFWCGRRDVLMCLQDTIISVHARQARRTPAKHQSRLKRNPYKSIFAKILRPKTS